MATSIDIVLRNWCGATLSAGISDSPVVVVVVVDVLDEPLKHVAALAVFVGLAAGDLAGQARVGEDPFGVAGRFLGNDDRPGDRFRDPPVLHGAARVVLALAGDDGGGAVELRDDAVTGDLADYWREGVIPTVHYPLYLSPRLMTLSM
ncbi:hypothetical protein ABZ442_20100 [Streptomyces triculaminicus]|uniref:hypothetical protein n=1 Tax=Streptomyces triculaminicus TaxID=2816232 RepID=UPI0033E0678D